MVTGGYRWYSTTVNNPTLSIYVTIIYLYVLAYIITILYIIETIRYHIRKIQGNNPQVKDFLNNLVTLLYEALN